MVFNETNVMYFSLQGIGNARLAFDHLESKLSSLHGRKFFGYYDPDTEEYRACVEITPEDPSPEKIGLRKWIIPPGKYVYEKILQWSGKTNSIGPTIEKLIRENRGIVDFSRPILEYYKSLNELRIMVPVQD